MASIADTGFVVSVAIQSDARHQVCIQVLRQEGKVYIMQPTLAKIAYMRLNFQIRSSTHRGEQLGLIDGISTNPLMRCTS